MKKYFLFVAAALIIAACTNSGNSGNKVNARQDRIEIPNDLENAKGMVPSWFNEKHVIAMTSPAAHSGNNACITTDTAEFSYQYQELLKNINIEVPKRVVFSGWVYTTIANPKFSVICNISENQKLYNWKAFPLDNTLKETGKWVEFSADFYLDDKPLKPEMEIRLYAWNQAKAPVYIDDLKVTFLY
jgi:hypothetical protein